MKKIILEMIDSKFKVKNSEVNGVNSNDEVIGINKGETFLDFSNMGLSEVEQHIDESIGKLILKRYKPELFDVILNIDNEFLDLIHSDNWPKSVLSNYVVETDVHKENRAAAIIDLFFNCNFKNKRVLDFGCGDGLIAKKLVDYGVEKIVGFDIKKQWIGENGKCILTDDWSIVVDNAPYDICLMYDVLDHMHCKGSILEYQLVILTAIIELMSKNSLFFTRVHPWFSRHSHHMFRTLNKAFVHFFLPKNELDVFEPCQPNFVLDPEYYSNLFSKTGLIEQSKVLISKEVEDFFENRILRTEIEKIWGDVDFNFLFNKILSIEFIDFVHRVR